MSTTKPQYSGAHLRTLLKRLLLFVSSLTLFGRPACGFFIDERQSPGRHEWNYADQFWWTRMSRECAGRAQSPIDIQHKNVITSHHLKLHFYNYNKPLKFKLANAHHTIKMNPTGTPAYEQDETGLMAAAGSGGYNSSSIHDFIAADEYVEFTPAAGAGSSQGQQLGVAGQLPDRGRLVGGPDQASQPPPPRAGHVFGRQNGKAGAVRPGGGRPMIASNHLDGPATRRNGGEPYEGAPTIKLDWLDDGNNEYKLRDIHFHWGERRDNGSEHAIDGRRAAMEMHLVHIKHGLDKSNIGFTSDSLAVIAILIESHRKSNADFNPIVNELARINSTETPQTIDYKSIYDLLPSNLDAFYTYSGSLTTPPCYQVVNWIVMAERLNMNAKQIEMFRNLYAPPSERAENESEQHEREREPHSKQHNQKSFQSLDEARGNGDDDATQPLDPAAEANERAHSTGAELIMPNVRSIQALNNRTILASFTKYGSRLKAALSGAAPTPLKSFQVAGRDLLLTLALALMSGGAMLGSFNSVARLIK